MRGVGSGDSECGDDNCSDVSSSGESGDADV